MLVGTFSFPLPTNEPVLSYGPNTPERKRLKAVLAELKKKQADIPMYIGGKEVKTDRKMSIHPPHERAHTLGHFYMVRFDVSFRIVPALTCPTTLR